MTFKIKIKVIIIGHLNFQNKTDGDFEFNA